MKNPFQSNDPALSPEQTILIHAARLELDTVARSGFETVVFNNPDWSEILALSARYGIQPLLWKHFSKDGLVKHIPQSVEQTLQGNVSRLALKAHLLHSELGLLLETVVRENIPVILLKGAFLAKNIYPDISLRPMSDIDILCPEGEIERLHNLLIRKGYSQPLSLKHETFQGMGCHLPPYVHPNGAVIEVHLHIFPEMHFSKMHIATIWDHARRDEKFPEPVYCLAYEDLLLFLIHHLHKHLKWGKGITLYWLADIHEVLVQFGGRINWDRFFKQAASLKTSAAVSSVLHLMKANWRTPLPKGIIIQAKTPVSKIHPERLFTLRVDAQQHYAQRFRHLWKVRGWPNKVRYCFSFFFPARAYIIQKYKVAEHASLTPFYLRHPLEVLWRVVRKLVLHRS